MSLIKCDNLTTGYNGKKVAEGISFEINSGEYFSIVGENGSGKSTLMKTILGLIPPLDGKIIFGDGLKKNQIGYLPQQTDIQRDFPATVYEIVLSGFQNSCGLRPFYSKAEKNTAYENMSLLNINDLAKKCYNELSGGQQQRVLLARALCATDKAILLDEPVAGLDPIVTNEMYALIEKINKENNVSVIMISHDISAVAKYSDKILHIGNEIYCNTKEEFLSKDKFAFLSEKGGASFAL